MTTMLLHHSASAISPFPGYTTTRETIFLQRSNLTISGSIVTAQGAWSLYGYPPRNAVVMDTSTLRISPSSLVRGGYIPGTPGTTPTSFVPSVAFTGTGPNAVYNDWRTPAANYGTVPVTTTWLHETFHDWVVADELFNIRVNGPLGGFALLALGDYVPWTQSPWGNSLAIDPMTAFLVGFVPLNAATGNYQWTLNCPSTALNGHPFALQALTLSQQGEIALTIPSPLTVAWDKDRIP